MSHIITIHSFGHAAGRSTLTANLSALLAQAGYRVGVMDADFQAPSLNLFFNLPEPELSGTLNSYLWGKLAMDAVVYDVTQRVGIPAPGSLHLVPASSAVVEVMQILHTPYNLDLLGEAVRYLDSDLGLDYLLLDTTPGLTEATMLAAAVSDTLIVVLSPDAHDYQGAAVSIEVARKLQVPQLLLVLNSAPESLDLVQAQDELTQCFECQVGTVLPYSEELALQASAGLVALTQPASLFSRRLKLLVGHLGVPRSGGKRAGSMPRAIL